MINNESQKNKRLTTLLKNKLFKGYEKLRNKMLSSTKVNFRCLSYDEGKNKEKDALIPEKAFLTGSNYIKTKVKKYRPKIRNKYFNNSNYNQDNQNIINSLFPNKNELSKYSNLPFISLFTIKTPFSNKISITKNKRYNNKILKDEFLYKISHNFEDEEKSLNNFIKNKGMKKGSTIQNFYNSLNPDGFKKRKSLEKKDIKLELNINNLTNDENKRVPLNIRDKHIQLLEDNIKSIRMIPTELMNGLEEDVFNNLGEDIKEEKNEDKNMHKGLFKLKDINKLILDFDEKNKRNLKNKENYYNNTSIGFKTPIQYPINFYSTQQMKKKEHFSQNFKNTFEERRKMLNSDKKTLNVKISDETVKKIDELIQRGKIDDRALYLKENKRRDMMMRKGLKYNFNQIDTKRILKGLKPWVDIDLNHQFKIDINDYETKPIHL